MAVLRLRTWLGVLAPLSTMSHDKRILSSRHEWTLRPGGAPLRLLDPTSSVVVGSVDVVRIFEGHIIASGIVYAEWVSLVRADLKPQLDLCYDPDDVWRHPEHEYLQFNGGTICGVTLGDQPAFPDVEFWLGEEIVLDD